MAGVTLDELVKEVQVLPEMLDKRCTDDHLGRISLFLDWQTVAPYLGLSETDLKGIESIGIDKELIKGLKTLMRWKAKFAPKATYRRLIEALLTTGRADHAEKVCELLKELIQPTALGESKHVMTTRPLLYPLPQQIKRDREPRESSRATLEAPQVTTRNMKDEIRGLEEEFDNLVDQAADDIEQSVKEGNTKLSRVKSTITRLPVSLRHHHIKFLTGNLSAINKAGNINELLSILDLNWNFMNIGLLERLIDRFGCTETHQRLERYLQRLKHFRVRTTVREFIGSWTCKSPGTMSKFVMEMREEWLDKTLEEVEEFKTELSLLCSLEHYALLLTGSSHNSVILSWALQRFFPMSAEILQPARQFLLGQGVLRVFFKGVCLLDLRPFQAVLSVEGASAGAGNILAHKQECKSQTSKEPEYIPSEESKETHDQIHQDCKQQQDQKDLFRACIDGDLDKAIELLTSGVEVDCRDEDGWTPLAIASRLGHVDLVHVLLAYNADVNARNEDKDSVLHWACVGGDSNVVEVLLQEGAEVDSRNEAGGTPLMYASSLGHADVVKVLLNAGADVNLEVLDKSTALIKASDNEHSEVVKLLLDAGANVNTQNQDGTTALMEACSRGYPGVVELLLERGADPSLRDEHGETALLKASYFCRSEIVQRLLSEGANIDVNKNGLNALMLTVKRIDPEAEKQLGITRDARLKTVEVLLEAKATINVQEQSTGRTALFSAVTDGDLDLVRLLLQKGADPEIIDEEGIKALDVAEVHGHHEICKELKKYYHQDEERPSRSEKKQSLMERVQKGALRLLVVFNNVQERILNRRDKNDALKSARREKPKSQLPLPY